MSLPTFLVDEAAVSCPNDISPGVSSNLPVSLDTVGTDVFLHTRLAEIYANSSLTVTQSYYFNPFKYAAEQPGKLILRELDNVQTIKRIVYLPARRRRDGDGLIGESTSFAGYRLAFGNEEVEAVSATVGSSFCLVLS